MKKNKIVAASTTSLVVAGFVMVVCNKFRNLNAKAVRFNVKVDKERLDN